MSQKGFQFALTYYQNVSLILIELLHDPEIILYLIPFIKNAEIDNNRLFHDLRMKVQWLSFNKPSDFTGDDLFKHKMLSNSYRQDIHYFRKGFLQKLDNRGISIENHIPLTVSESIEAVSCMFDKQKLRGELFRRFYSFLSINQCFSEFMNYQKNDPLTTIHHPPYMLIHIPPKWKEKKYSICEIQPWTFTYCDENYCGLFIESIY